MIQPYLKPWLIPDNRLGIKYFYEGLPSWESRIPWHIGIKPAFGMGSTGYCPLSDNDLYDGRHSSTMDRTRKTYVSFGTATT